MPLSNIAHAVSRTTVTAMLAQRSVNASTFRTTVLTYLNNKFPAANITAADLAALRVVVVDYPQLGLVGFGRGPYDAVAAAEAKWKAANPGLKLPVGG